MVLVIVLFRNTPNSYGQSIVTIAGMGGSGYNGDGIPATAAQLYGLIGLAVDTSGNIYISEGDRVRKVNTVGVISTVAGTGVQGFSGDGGPATAAMINGVISASCDRYGNVFLGEGYGNRIRKINSSGIISTVAGTGTGSFSGDGGPATAANIIVMGIYVASNGEIYFCGGARIRKINTSGTISTIAGTGTVGLSGDGGPATAALLSNSTFGITGDNHGNIFFIDYAAYNDYRVRKINASGIIVNYAGCGTSYPGDGGAATNTFLIGPRGIASDTLGNIFICDLARVREISLSGTITTIAGPGNTVMFVSGTSFPVVGYNGDGIAATAANVILMNGIATDRSGNVYVSDVNNTRLRKINVSTGIISTIAGMGHGGYNGDGISATSAYLFTPSSVALDGAGNVHISESRGARVRKILPGGVIITVAGKDSTGHSGDGGPATAAKLSYVSGIAFDTSGNLYIADCFYIRKVNPSGTITTIAGLGGGGSTNDGIYATAAHVDNTGAITTDRSGNLYFADGGSNRIRKINSSGIISTVAGTLSGGYTADGHPASASVIYLSSMYTRIFADSGNLYFSEWTKVRKVNTSGILSTFYNPTTSTYHPNILGFTFDRNGNLYVSDNNIIKKMDTSGAVTTFAGTGVVSYTGDGGPASTAGFNGNGDLMIDSNGVIYVCDMGNHTVRKICNLPALSSITGADSLCAGQGITLSDSVTGGAWTSSSTAIASIDSIGHLFAVANGNATVTYSLNNTCGTAIRTHSAWVNPLPHAAAISGTDSLCAGYTSTFTDATSGGAWMSTNPSIASVNSSGLVSSLMPGAVNILYIVTNSCGSDTAVFPFVVKDMTACPDAVAGIELEAGSLLSVYPNPNDGNFTIAGNVSSGSTVDLTFEIRDVIGRVVKTGSGPVINGKFEIPVQLDRALNEGYYYVRIFAGGVVLTRSFVVGR